MIDLTKPYMPSQIECDGIFYEVDTSFRTWIEFDYQLREERRYYYGIFKEDIPLSMDWVDAAIEFLESKNVTPKIKNPIAEKTVDLILDGDYIVAAFQQAYGIDLTDPDCDIHWHRFKALLIGLPEDTLMAKIMSYRGWRKKPETKDKDKDHRELKEMWTFPEPDLEERKRRALEIVNSWFE